MDVGEDSTGGDGDAGEKLVELLVVLDREGDVAGADPGLLVVAGSVAGELKDLGAEVLEDTGNVDAGAHADALGVSSLLEVGPHTSDGELKSGLGRTRDTLSASASSLSFSFSCGEGGRRVRCGEVWR